ncbi:hypothetical protein WL14_07470 [Burkholderia cepacia]|nr:hypothetical protein WJ46_25115 [Burkholderia cepacia]KVQ22827.1 hypothetical protein WK02_32860 [Burkholderia cepacia]KVZ27593.1 hypothetical protein WL14_07470 [Burkholderia cepacia]
MFPVTNAVPGIRTGLASETTANVPLPVRDGNNDAHTAGIARRVPFAAISVPQRSFPRGVHTYLPPYFSLENSSLPKR